MIIDKTDDSTAAVINADLPPSYDDLIGPRDALPDPPSLKPPFSHLPSSYSPTTPISPSTSSNQSGPSTPSSRSQPSSAWSWWPLAQRTPAQLQVQDTVRGLLHKILTKYIPTAFGDDPEPAIGILQSCATACAGYDIPFPPLLHERFAEGHSIIYWVIVKQHIPKTGNSDEREENTLLKTLLEYAHPLSPAALSEARSATLVASDHYTFCRYLAPLSVSQEDRFLLDLVPGQVPDEITVDERGGADDEFSVNFILDEFQKRIGVRGRIEIEFVVANRLFRLVLTTSPPASISRKGKETMSPLFFTLSLTDGSLPTWIDSRLLIPDASSYDPSQPAQKRKEKPTITLRLKTAYDSLRGSDEPLYATPVPPPDDLAKLGFRTHTKRHERRQARNKFAEEMQLANEISVGLGQSLMGNGLMYSGTAYIAPDRKLRARLEARLGKAESDSDCVIC